MSAFSLLYLPGIRIVPNLLGCESPDWHTGDHSTVRCSSSLLIENASARRTHLRAGRHPRKHWRSSCV